MTVKNASVAAKKLTALLKKIGPVDAPVFPGAGDPIAGLIMSMLLWDSTTDKAQAAYVRLMEQLVDYNDLRVCMPHETVDIIGPRYPRALDRCQRLRAVLRNIFLREHAMKLDRLPSTGKREIKKYIESLEGIVPFAAARSLLLSFDVHAIPVDDQLRTHLVEAEICDASVEITVLSNWLSTQVKPGEGAATHFALQSWMDELADGSKGAKKPAKTKTAKRDQRSGAKAAAN
jgi:hypothetical protein